MAALPDPERRLAEAVATGSVLELGDAEVPAAALREALLATPRGDPRGLRVHGGRFPGSLDLEGMVLDRPIRLVGSEFPDRIWLRGAQLALLDLRRCRIGELNATEATVDRVLLLTCVEVADGTIRLDGARVGGTCSLRDARLRCTARSAFVGDRMRVTGELTLDGLTAVGAGAGGAVSLVGARVDGRVSARRLHATNPSGPALLAESLQATDTIDLSSGTELRGHGAKGAVRLVGARAASISLGGATLENPAGWSVAAHYFELGGTLYLDGVQAVGGVRLAGARLGGQLNLERATVDGGADSALAATRLRVDQAVRMQDAVLRCAGDAPAVELRSARIGGDLDLARTRVANPGGVALRLNTAAVEGRAVLSELVVERGGLDFRDSAVGTFYDDPAGALPDEDGFVELSGLTYRGVPGHPGVSVADRLAWLARMTAYAAQPYRQLAAAYRAAGHEDEARRVLVAQQEHLHRTLTGWARLRHRLFGLALQYGYQPARAVALLAAVLAVAVGLFLGLAGGTVAQAGGTVAQAGGTVAQAGGGCPAVDRIGLALDAAVPLVTTGAGERCQLATGTGPGQALAAAGWLLTLLGWASATLVVAGYSGWVRRR
jgi:hypothetical protein